MSDLVVLGFDGENSADEVLTKLRAMQKEHLIDLEDACVAVRTDDGKVQLKQSVNMAAMGAATGGTWGALWGTLIGLLFLNPLAGLIVGGAAGAGVGALSGSFADYGINDDFIKQLTGTITPGSSALFVLVRSSTPDKVLPEIEPYHPRVLKTSLSNEQEKQLRDELAKVQAARPDLSAWRRPMLFSILIYGEEGLFDTLSEAEQEALLDKHRGMQADLAKTGRLGPTAKLMGTSTAVTIRGGAQSPVVLDGPFAETKEQLLGFYVIAADSIEEAIAAAKKLPLDVATMEIRPIGWFGDYAIDKES